MDLSSHEERNWLPAYAITIQAITTALLSIRLISRVRSGGQAGLDDAFITIAWALGTGLIVVVLLGNYRYGWNRHIWNVPEEAWHRGWLIGTIGELLFFSSTSFTKVSVLLFYRRLVVGTFNNKFKWALWTAIGFVVVYTIVFSILIITACSPVEALWMRYELSYTTPYKCVDVNLQVRLAKLAGALSVITDFYSVMLPAVLLSHIRVSTRQRLGLFFIFGLGFLVVGAGIARTIFLARVEGPGIDKTWQAFDVFVASIAECNVGIICACAPSLKSLFRAFFRDITTKMSSGKSGSKSQATTDSSLTSHVGSASKNDSITKPGRSKIVNGISLTPIARRPSKAWTKPFARNRGPANGEKQEGDSFKETHEFGSESTGCVAAGYDDIEIDTIKKHSHTKHTQRSQTLEAVDPHNPTSFVFPPSSNDGTESDHQDERSLIGTSVDSSFELINPSPSPLSESHYTNPPHTRVLASSITSPQSVHSGTSSEMGIPSLVYSPLSTTSTLPVGRNHPQSLQRTLSKEKRKKEAGG